MHDKAQHTVHAFECCYVMCTGSVTNVYTLTACTGTARHMTYVASRVAVLLNYTACGEHCVQLSIEAANTGYSRLKCCCVYFSNNEPADCTGITAYPSGSACHRLMQEQYLAALLLWLGAGGWCVWGMGGEP